MIGGFIVLGTAAERLIVRALGPSVPVAGTIPNPLLELHDQNGALIRANDDWRSDQLTEIQGTGVPPANDRESAIVTSLTPAAYTAIVRDAGGATGVALVEVYGLN